jgi:hypothetical protein
MSLLKHSFGPVAAALLAVGAMLLWIPGTHLWGGEYMEASLFEGFRMRSLIGTLVDLLGLSKTGYTVIKLASIVGWLALVISLITNRARALQQPIRPGTWIGIVLLALTFATSTLMVMSVGPIDLVDGVAALVILLCALQLKDGPVNSPPKQLLLTLCLVAAVVVHEKVIFEIMILGLWYAWRQGTVHALFRFAPAILGIGVFLVLAGSNTTGDGLVVTEYAQGLKATYYFLLERSFNVPGVIIGAGAFWFLYAVLTYRFVIAGSRETDRPWRACVALGMAFICMAQLLIAHDTNRLVATMWLPVLLLLLETDFLVLIGGTMARVLLAAGVVFQALTPPMLVYEHGMLPYNCPTIHFGREVLGWANPDLSVWQRPFRLHLHPPREIPEGLDTMCESGTDLLRE